MKNPRVEPMTREISAHDQGKRGNRGMIERKVRTGRIRAVHPICWVIDPGGGVIGFIMVFGLCGGLLRQRELFGVVLDCI